MQEKFSDLWTRGLQHSSDLLIRRGTAMGPLIPLLFLVPFFLIAAYSFLGYPWISTPLAIAAVGIVIEYFRQYSKFAKSDPDRLQSEEYRYEMKKIQMIAGKEFPSPVSVDELNLPTPTSNPMHPMPNVNEILINDNGEEK